MAMIMSVRIDRAPFIPVSRSSPDSVDRRRPQERPRVVWPVSLLVIMGWRTVDGPLPARHSLAATPVPRLVADPSTLSRKFKSGRSEPHPMVVWGTVGIAIARVGTEKSCRRRYHQPVASCSPVHWNLVSTLLKCRGAKSQPSVNAIPVWGITVARSAFVGSTGSWP